MMIFGLLMIFMGDSCKDRWTNFIRSLQLIIIQPMINISFPQINLDLLNQLQNTSSYDILGNYNIWQYFPFLKFNSYDVPFINEQMQNISFSDRNAFKGLSSVTVYIFAYIMNVFIVAIFKIYLIISKGKFGGMRMYNYLITGLFFNTILSMTMETYLDFII